MWPDVDNRSDFLRGGLRREVRRRFRVPHRDSDDSLILDWPPLVLKRPCKHDPIPRDSLRSKGLRPLCDSFQTWRRTLRRHWHIHGRKRRVRGPSRSRTPSRDNNRSLRSWHGSSHIRTRRFSHSSRRDDRASRRPSHRPSSRSRTAFFRRV